MKPYIQTFTCVAGGTSCNAHCEFCISKQTPNCGVPAKPTEINERNFRIGMSIAKDNGAFTGLITSKGEATLFPENITQCVKLLSEKFPLIELQTNGIRLMEDMFCNSDMLAGKCYLQEWYDMGLTTIALSSVHYEQDRNKEIYSDKYPDLKELVKVLHNIGYSVRLTCMLLKGYIDNLEKFEKLVDFCKDLGVEQLTVRCISTPEERTEENADVYDWTKDNQSSQVFLALLKGLLEEDATKLMSLVHGAQIYDYKGQNVCLSNCLTEGEEGENTNDVRQLIYFPDGHIRYSWQYEGAIII